jgi:hypothetical protein
MTAVATRATELTNIGTAATVRRFRCGVVVIAHRWGKLE